MAESPKMLMDKEGPLGWITFNQPEKRNAVSQEMWQMVPDIVKDLEEDEGIRVIIPRPGYCTDNAAMVAAAGRRAYLDGRTAGWDLEAEADLAIGDEPRPVMTRARRA